MVSIGRDGPGLEPAAPRGWPELLAELLNGVAHTLNNRAATVRAVHSLLAADAGESPAHRLLESEAAQLESVVNLLRLAGGRARGEPEPFLPATLLQDAELLYRQHDVLRDVPLTLRADAREAAVARPEPLLHAFMVLLDAAGRVAARHGGALEAATRDGDGVVELAVRVPAAAPVDEARAQALAAAAGMAAVAGAQVRSPGADGELHLVLSVPTLQAVRAARG